MSANPQAREWSRKSRPTTAKIPAAAPTTAPLISVLTFWETSALASSISSRTSSETRSETSWTASPRVGSGRVCGGSAAKALEQHGEDEAAGEGGSHEDLGTVGGHLRRLVGGRGALGPGRIGRRGRRRERRRGGERRRVRRRGGGLLGLAHGHSGGSSPNARRHISVAVFEVATLASAPSPASRPDQTRRLTRSDSIIAGDSTANRGRSSRRSVPGPPRGRPRRRAGRRRSSP